MGRGGFGAAIFFVLLVALFGRPVAPSFALAALMFLIYVPLGHYIDRFLYNRRQAARRRREHERRAQGQ